MEDPTLFDRRAAAYERGRPAYPAALYRRLAELGLMRPGLRVLEVGAGTGQATAELVAAGVHVTAVEPGAALAVRIAATLPAVPVLVTRLEDADLAPGSFDAAICATALHWLDLDTALPKLHDALTSRGLLAVWWTVFGNSGIRTPFRDRVAAIAARRQTGPRTHPTPLATDYWTRALTRDGSFALVETRQFPWAVDLDASQVRDLFATFTEWSDAEVEEVSSYVDQLGGVVTEHYLTVLYVCRAATRSE